MKVTTIIRRMGIPSGIVCTGLLLLSQAAGLADIIPTWRVSNWQGNVGVDGGIPNSSNMVIYTIIPAGASLATINNAIANCPSNQVVQLSAGTYSLSGTLQFNDRNGVVLRGAGKKITILRFTSGGIELDGSAQVGLYRTLGNQGTPQHLANWIGGYGLGTNKIVLSSVSGLSVGTWICLDQLNDNDNVDANGGEGLCSYCGRGNGSRAQMMWTQVKGINGATVTINPPLFMPNWGGVSPQVWWCDGNWISKCGIESLTVDGMQSGGLGAYGGNIYIFAGMNCWVKDVISKAPGQSRTHLLHYGGARCEMRHCDLIGTLATTLSYAVTPVWATADWHEDNVIDSVTGSIPPGWGAHAIINSYNFITKNVRLDNPSWNQLAINMHDAHGCAWLEEGNYCNGYLGDFIHGSGGYITLFRNRFHGRNPNTTLLTYPIVLQSKNRYLNSVGNILGTAGYHNRYMDIGESLSQKAIYLLGWMNGQSAYDPKVVSTLYAHGNYDVVNNGIVWASTNTDHSIPASLLYSAKPAWFGNLPWPPYDPANGAAIVANPMSHTNIPAGYRYVFGVDPPTGPANKPPVASAKASTNSGSAPLTVTFSSTGSYDPEGVSLTYMWTFGDGTTSTAANPSHSYSSAGTYSAQMKVSDGVNTSSSASLTITVTAAAGNRPPVAVASVNPPAGAAPLSTTFSSAGSSDPEGTGLTYNWNFGDGTASTNANPTHVYQRAGVYSASLTVADGTNQTTSSLIRITAANGTSGLVAAYGFEEGSGSGVTDASGNENNGALSGATRAGGKFGQGLAFNGTNCLVTVIDSPSLIMTTAMTVEAWVYPTAVKSDWMTLVLKGNSSTLAYALQGATPPNMGPSFYSGPASSNLVGPSSLTLNTWSHLAGTYDGTTQRLFLNGVLVASRAQSGEIAASTDVLTIGGNALSGSASWIGQIDEVRIYNRALSQAEITVDMNTPVLQTVTRPAAPAGLHVVAQ